MIRTVLVEDEPLAQQYLEALLSETGRVEVIGAAGEGQAGLRLCSEHRPDVAFLDIRLPGPDGVALAAHLLTLSHPPLVVFVTGHADRALDAFQVEAVDYLLKPLDPEQVAQCVRRLERRLTANTGVSAPPAPLALGDRLPVRDARDFDVTRLLAPAEIVAALRRGRRTWVHTAGDEFSTYYPLADLARWLYGAPFLRVARDALVNLHAIAEIVHYGDRLYQVRLRDRANSVVEVSRSGATRLAARLKPPF